MSNFVLRTHVSRHALDAWTLVLASQEIPYRTFREGSLWHLCVDEGDAARAERLLDLHDGEAEDARVRALAASRDHAQPMAPGASEAGFAMAACLAAVQLYFWSVPRDPEWIDAGAARAARIFDGELWRCATALTLHVDGPHLLGNVFSLAVFGWGVCAVLGPGLGFGAIVLSGVMANLANAWVQYPDLNAVGASTAVFGAVGILSGLQAMRRFARPWRGSPWIPVAGGIGVLAMLGMGDVPVDVVGHGLGLLCGVLVGLALGLSLERPAAPALQVLVAGAASCGLGAAWWLALGA